MSFSDDYEFDPNGESDEEYNVSPEPPSWAYPIINSFEESLLTTRLMELCPPPKPGPMMGLTRDELELVPDYAQPFAGALINIAEQLSDLSGKPVTEQVELLGDDLDKIHHFLGIHALIAFYVARFYRLDLNAVLDQAMTRIENESTEDRKLAASLAELNMTHGGSVIERSATQDEWPDPQF